MKIMIIGANGFLGRKLVTKCRDFDEVLAVDLTFGTVTTGCPQFEIDITNQEAITHLITTHTPDLVMLTAAMTNVDACEDAPDQAYAINALGPQYVAEATAAIKGRMIHISTDFVFDGQQGDYRESDPPAPLSVYGKTKLQGEQFVQASQVPALICRTSVLYGCPDPDQHANFFSWAYQSLRDGKSLKIVDGQITTPTLVDDLVSFLFGMRYFDRPVLLHTTGPQPVSKYDMVKSIVEHFHFDPVLLTKVDYFPQKAPRPPNSSLNTAKIQALNIHEFRPLPASFSYLHTHYPTFFDID